MQNDISKILENGESYTTEFKRSLNKEIKNEICSFVNSSGGKLLVGVDDNGTVCGIVIDNKIRSQLQTSILKELKLIEHIGSDKKGYWTIYYKSNM